jgi:hypothetical protein
MHNFSTITFYWGSDINLYNYVEETSKYTDDIVIGYVDLFGEIPKIDGARIIPFDHSYLLDNGHSAMLNKLDSEAKYDWTFHAAVGKRITWLDEDLILNSRPDICGYASTEKNLGGAWSNLHNKKGAEWTKTVHEVISPKPNFILSSQVAIEWERVPYSYNGEVHKRASAMYRQMTRTKWVALEDTNPHPARNKAINMYNMHKDAYSLDRENLLYYMLKNDLEAGM